MRKPSRFKKRQRVKQPHDRPLDEQMQLQRQHHERQQQLARNPAAAREPAAAPPPAPAYRKKVVALVNDLFFTVKITDAARHAGMALELVKDPQQVLAQEEKPSVIIFDLNFEEARPLELIARIKNDPEFKGVSLIGYLSHVQGELKQAAQEAGCDIVMARSAFSQNLPQILKRHSGVI
jgi:PleD family two-component response regulator